MREPEVIADLRARIARIEGATSRYAAHPFGVDAIDRHLPGGGLASGVLHEVAGSPDLADDAGATIFLAGIVLVRQKPGSAKGVMFITLEDETEVANLVVWTNVFEANRRTVFGA